jgi:subtilase family serine protease
VGWVARFGILAGAALAAAGCSTADGDDDRADLTITSATVSPSLPVTGDTIRVTFRVANRGFSSATAATWRISLGITVVSGTLPALDDGEATTISHAFTATDPTNVTVTASVDTGNAVDERDEGNNTLSALVTIAPSGGG